MLGQASDLLEPGHRLHALGKETDAADPAPGFDGRVYSLVARAAAQPDVRAAVEANHDDNRWWPLSVSDWRVRMTVAGWSTRVSYAMIDTYSGVVSRADALGWDGLTALDDGAATALVRPLGLAASRVRYLRSLAGFVASRRGGRDRPGGHARLRTLSGCSRRASAARATRSPSAPRCTPAATTAASSPWTPAWSPGSRHSSASASAPGRPRTSSSASMLEASTDRHGRAVPGPRQPGSATGSPSPTTRPPPGSCTWSSSTSSACTSTGPRPRLCQRRPACDAFLDCQCTARLTAGATPERSA